MKKLLVLSFTAGLLATAMVSCDKEDSADVNQDKIYCEYNLFYNANEDKTHAIARFRFGGPTGTLLELTDSTGAGVTYNGDVLPYDVWWSAHHKEYAGDQTGTPGAFVYTNTEGTVYTNTPPAGNSIAFEAGFDTINKSVAENLTWVGDPLAADEQVSVFVGSWTWGDDALFFTDSDGATEIVMGVTAKSNLALGSSTVYMDRATVSTTIDITFRIDRRITCVRWLFPYNNSGCTYL